VWRSRFFRALAAAAFFEPWQLNRSRLGRQAARARRESKKGQEQRKSKKIAIFLQLQKATLGSTGRHPGARSVLHCHAV